MDLNLGDFFYELPESRIAKHPPKQRGTSKLLVYRNGAIEHRHFDTIVDELPERTTLVFNKRQ